MLHLFRGLLGVISLLLLAGGARAQGPVGYGDWQLHLPTNHPLYLADAGDRVYVATADAFYFLDKSLNTTQVLSSRDGLSDVGVVALAHDSVTQQTVLGYRNTNLDLITRNGRIVNLNDVLRKAIQGAKQINQISIGNRQAFVSTSFGLVVIDLDKREITDTYSNIGPGGAVVAVYDAAASGGFLYLATSAGLLRGRQTDNLLDFRNWTRYLPAPLGTTQSPYRQIAATASGQVYAAINGTGVFVFVPGSPGSWQNLGAYSGEYRNLRGEANSVLVVDDNSGVRRLERSGAQPVVVPAIAGDFTEDAVRSRDGSFYVARYTLGLQRLRPGSGQAPEVYEANGPERSDAFSLLADARSNTVNVFTGGFTERYDPGPGKRLGFYEYANQQWTNFTPKALPSTADFPDFLNPSRGTRTPDGTLYVAAFGGGLLEWQGPGKFRRFGQNTPAGSPLLVTFGLANSNRIDVTDVAATADGKVWVANRHLQAGRSGLSLFDPAASTWQTVPWQSGLEALDRLALDDLGNVWASVARKTDPTGAALGIFAIDPTGASQPRFFTTANGLPDNQIYELAKDRRGYIWAATIQGVAVFNDPAGPFQSTLGFTKPLVRRGEGAGFDALFTEAVRAIAVDGGDRKWFATDHGLWLFSPDADEALLHFTKANSPLPSDRIVDVKVNDKTGDVWVATDAGVVAYRGAATVTEGKPDCAAAFPNPVRPGFQGQVGIRGLANNALVKITDVAGHLVYATTAAGGTVTWNLTMPNGQRVRPGVYLVLSTDADGQNGCVSKVAVLGN